MPKKSKSTPDVALLIEALYRDAVRTSNAADAMESMVAHLPIADRGAARESIAYTRGYAAALADVNAQHPQGVKPNRVFEIRMNSAAERYKYKESGA